MSKLEMTFDRVRRFRQKFDYTVTGVVHIEIHGDLSGKITINVPQQPPIQYDWANINMDGSDQINLALDAAEVYKPLYLLKHQVSPPIVYFYEGPVSTQSLPSGTYMCYKIDLDNLKLVEVSFEDVVSDI